MAENRSAVLKSLSLIDDSFQLGKVGEMADANLLLCPLLVEIKLGHSLNQLKVQQLHKLQEQLCSSSIAPNLILQNDPDHIGAQIVPISKQTLIDRINSLPLLFPVLL